MDKELSMLIAAFSNLNLCSIYFMPANREKSGAIFSPLSFSITNLSTSASNANPTLHSFSTISFESDSNGSSVGLIIRLNVPGESFIV